MHRTATYLGLLKADADRVDTVVGVLKPEAVFTAEEELTLIPEDEDEELEALRAVPTNPGSWVSYILAR